MQLPAIKKIITDTDIDGIVSLAILKNIFPKATVVFSDPSQIKTEHAELIDKYTLIADLPYLEGCGMYFDHHLSNRPQKPIPAGLWREEKSAARVIYDYFAKDYDLSRFEKILPDIDKFDSGDLRTNDVREPNLVIRLCYLTEITDLNFFLRLTDLLNQASIEEIFENREVIRKDRAIKRQIKSMQANLINRIDVSEKVVFVDVRNSDFGSIHVTQMELELIAFDVIAVFKGDGIVTRISLFQNALIPSTKEYDLLSIVKTINPRNSGGHKMGCGMNMPLDMSEKEVKQKIIDLVALQ